MRFLQMEKESSNTRLNIVIDELERFTKMLLTKERRRHTIGVLNFSLFLNEKHNLGLDEMMIRIAALGHDLFRDVGERKMLLIAKAYGIEPNEIEARKPVLLHSKIAARYLKRKLGEGYDEIMEAVEYHTSGRRNMGKLAKLIFISDSLEENRSFPGVEKLREMVIEDFETGFFEVLKNKLEYVISNDLILLPESVELWNSIVMM